MLSGELATYLSGRYFECSVYSLSYSEFLVFHKLVDDDHSLDLYTRFGGLPYLINLPLGNEAFEYINALYSTIVYRDVVSRYNVRSTDFLERLLLFLADNIGSQFSAKKISDFLKSQRVNIAPNQVMQFSSYLASAYIVHEVGRFDLIGKRIFEIGSKFYFENTGIRNSITGYAIKDRGKLMENIVFNQLLYMGYEVKTGTMDGREIDFVADRRGERLYVQVAAELTKQETIDREFGNLLAIPDNYPKIVVSGDQFTGNTYEGVQHMHIREFLKQE
jgi:predicted AAA+ superfamily ATPase